MWGRGTERELFFKLNFNITGIFFFFFLYTQRRLFLFHFSCTLFSPLTGSLQPQGSQFLEWLPPLRLSGVIKPCAWSMPCHVTGDAHSYLPSTVLLLPDQSTRRQHNKSKCNQLQYYSTASPSPSLQHLMSDIYYSAAMGTQTEISAVIQSTLNAWMAVSLMLHECVLEIHHRWFFRFH